MSQDKSDTVTHFQRLSIDANGDPVYRQIADEIVRLIRSKELGDGDRLPPLRELAQLIGVNVTTITRAIDLVRQRGFVESRAGSGSYVRHSRQDRLPRSGVIEEQGLCDLSINRPATDAYLRAMGDLLPSLAKDRRFSAIQDYHAPAGDVRVRDALSGWLSSATGHTDPTRLVVTNGAQHGLSCVVDAIAQPGDVILTDMITFQGFISICGSRAIDLVGVRSDSEGMSPEALREACLRHRPKAVFLMPTFHNPTTHTLSAERRLALASIANQHSAYIIEDDLCAPLLEKPITSIASAFPDITFHVTSLSKCVAAGIRMGAVSAPEKLAPDVAASLRTNCWSSNSLGCLIIAKLIEQNLLDDIVAQERQELRSRCEIAMTILGTLHMQIQPGSPFAWLELPDPWRSASFVKAARDRGICVLASDAFLLSRDQEPVHAVRININAARSESELRAGLLTLHSLAVSGRRKALLG